MRIVPFVISLVITIALIILLDKQLPVGASKTPRLGYFLSPQKGFWQNAEATDALFNDNLQFNALQGNAEVYFDDRLVPHIYADKDEDAYFIEGYLHAKFRLWQMEFQTYAAAGRLSEILGAESNGTNFLQIDKFFRRLGMVYAAENSLTAIESDPETKTICDAYTAGVNSYINSLTEDQYPLEYKLLNYKPEAWTNLKTALFLKYMAYDLSYDGNDFEATNAKSVFTKEQYAKLYPYGQDSVRPIFPKGVEFPKPGVKPRKPVNADSLYFKFRDSIIVAANTLRPDKDNGSNNWAVNGLKTKSGRPILCNDPHLGLNLPSLWYELQISTPTHNVYGASFPGAPSVVIGFNDSCAWGVTNAERDVMDYYEVQFKDAHMQQYMYNNEWQTTKFRKEVIKIKGQPDDVENIAMTVWGPVMYDINFPNKLNFAKSYAVRWTAHAKSNELKTFIKLNNAKNFDDYVSAISTYQCPGQNFVFASKSGDVAIRQQGNFIAKWRGQGDFVMPGDDTSFAWQASVPDSENIIRKNPISNYVSSANQYPYDTSYAYYMGGDGYEEFRGIQIKHRLGNKDDFSAEDMQHVQTDNYNVFAEMAKPVLMKYMHDSLLSNDEIKYYNIFKQWDLRNEANSEGASVFMPWWDSLMVCVYQDELAQSKLPLPQVDHSTLLESLLKDSAYEFADDITTPKKETMDDMVLKAFKKVVPVLQQAEANGELAWGNFKHGAIRHLLRIPALSNMNVVSGGGVHIINAFKQYHGPSWRMVVELTDDTQAYVIYPGGQSGNPGSKYYDSFINDWAAYKYYKVAIVTRQVLQANNKGKISFSKS